MSGALSEKLQKLDDFLSSEAVHEDAMLLSELDGFLAGLIVCPDLVLPSEWLPLIWGEEAPVFDSQDQAQSFLDLIMAHYNDVIGQLNQGRYSPIYQIDLDDSTFWELWIEGFWQAMCLRPEAWTLLAESEDTDLQRALFVLGRLVEIAQQPEDFESLEIDEELETLAPDLIPFHVEILHRARLVQAGSVAGSANQNVPKAGRDDP